MKQRPAEKRKWAREYFLAVARLELATVGTIDSAPVNWAKKKPAVPLAYDAVYVNLSFAIALDFLKSEPAMLRAEDMLDTTGAAGGAFAFFFNWVAAWELREPLRVIRPTVVEVMNTQFISVCFSTGWRRGSCVKNSSMRICTRLCEKNKLFSDVVLLPLGAAGRVEARDRHRRVSHRRQEHR